MVDNQDNLIEPGLQPEVTDKAEDNAGGGYGEEGVLDLIASEGLEQKKRSGAFVLVGVVVVAAVGLFSMHTLTKVQAGDGADPTTNKTVDDFLKNISGTGSDTEKHLQAISVIEGDYTSNQVAADKLGPDPFTVGTVETTKTPTTVATTGNKQQDVERAIKDIKVQALLLGTRPTAFVNGKTLKIGDTFEVRKIEFKLTAIANDSVTVLAEYPDDDVKVEQTVFMKRW